MESGSPSKPDDPPNRHSHYFRTDHLRVDLEARAARGGAVTITTQAGRFVITIAATSVMARLLTPQDYGLIGMVAVVMGFVSIYKDLGLTSVTVQKKEITSDQISTLFWVNVALSLGISLCTVLTAPLVALFYGEPRLTLITIFTTFGFLLSGLTIQHGPVRPAHIYRTIAPFAVASGIGLVSAFSFRHYQPGIRPLLGIAICLAIISVTFCLVLCLLPSGRRALKDAIHSLALLRKQKVQDSSLSHKKSKHDQQSST